MKDGAPHAPIYRARGWLGREIMCGGYSLAQVVAEMRVTVNKGGETVRIEYGVSGALEFSNKWGEKWLKSKLWCSAKALVNNVAGG